MYEQEHPVSRQQGSKMDKLRVRFKIALVMLIAVLVIAGMD